MSQSTTPKGRGGATAKAGKKAGRTRSTTAVEKEDALTCVLCNKFFVDANDKLVECERCRHWHCTDCLKFSDAKYDLLCDPEVHWYCRKCQEPAVLAVQTDMEIKERCDMYMAKFSERMEALETEVKKKANKSVVDKLQTRLDVFEESGEVKQRDFEAKMKVTIAEMRNEQVEIERRRANLIIYKQAETEDVGIESGRTADKRTVEGMFRDLQVDVKARFITRLGKKIEGQDRPIKVTMTCEADKIRVIDRITELRRSTEEGGKATLRQLHIVADMTATQRLERKTLIQELERRRAAGEDDIVIRNNRIVKHSFRGRGQPANVAEQ